MWVSCAAALQGGAAGAEQLYTRPAGGSITVPCLFSFHGEKKLFCRNQCEGGDKLIETRDDSFQSGRYGIQYNAGSWIQKATLFVSITHLVRSDSGSYRCVLKERRVSDGHDTFHLTVVDGEFLLHVSPQLRPFLKTRRVQNVSAAELKAPQRGYFKCCKTALL